MPRTTAILSPNVAVDVYYLVNGVISDTVNQATLTRQTAGGKGINAGRALRALGGSPCCIGIVGGEFGQFVRDEVMREGIDAILIQSESATRVVASVIDSESGHSTVFSSRGDPVDEGAISEFTKVALATGTTAWACLMTGSLPQSMPETTYGSLIRHLCAAGKRVCIDANGAPLRHAVAAGAWIVKVNRTEFDHSFPGGNPRALMESAPGLEAVIVTNGAAGTEVHLQDGYSFRVSTPLARAVSGIGGGDTFAAALLHHVEQGNDFETSARGASAAAAANALHIGSGEVDVVDLPALEAATVLCPLARQHP
jgi:fructose-1-phosphate kinase PfkB-like protein